jgi:hypothetical protein
VPGCVLRVSTRTSDVERAVEASGLRPIVIFRKGTPKLPGVSTLASASGFNVDVSRHESFARQVRDAIGFLRRYRSGLGRLRRLGHVDGMTLDFSARPSRSTVPWPSYRFPGALVGLAAEQEIEIELSLYSRE